MWQEHSLQMEWCLDCHRNPERYVRPRSAVFRVDYEAPAESARARQAAGRGVPDSEAHELLDVSSMSRPLTAIRASGSGFAGENSKPEAEASERGSIAGTLAHARGTGTGSGVSGAPLQRVPLGGRGDYRSGRAAHVPEADGRVDGAGGSHRRARVSRRRRSSRTCASPKS